MHRVLRPGEIELRPFVSEWTDGFARFALVDRAAGSVHMRLGLCSLEPEGRLDTHLHAFEESFYVLEGTPTLVLDGRAYPLESESSGVVPVGVPHGWLGAGSAPGRWIEVQAPQPRDAGLPRDTFFLGRVGTDASKATRVVSRQLAAPLGEESGISIEMLVDGDLGAHLHTMFLVEYEPGAGLDPHDHPFEEAYVILDGEVEAVADGTLYLLRQGGVLWTGVGCIHAFANTSKRMVRWLELQAPQPPAQHGLRFVTGGLPAGEELVMPSPTRLRQ